MRIGEAAAAAGLTASAVRFYESEGLLGDAPRSDGGYRLYSAADVRRLKFIRRARTLGVPLQAVRELVRSAFEVRCHDFEPQLKEALDRRLEDVQRQIVELQLLNEQLQSLRGHLNIDCSCDHPAGECSGCNLLGEDGETAGRCSCGSGSHSISK
jgi:MerR family Zn(II)-responsive transcriptional regulator of zntA